MKLRPMKDAPKDREIFAVMLRTDHYGSPMPGKIDWGNFHPIQWKDHKWVEGYRPHWGMRWNEDFHATLADYGGWIDPKEIQAALCSSPPPGTDREPEYLRQRREHPNE